MEFSFQFQKLCHIKRHRWIFVVGVVAMTYLLFQSLLLPYGNALRSMLPDNGDSLFDRNAFPSAKLSVKSGLVRSTLAVNESDSINEIDLVGQVKNSVSSMVDRDIEDDSALNGNDGGTVNDFVSEGNDPDDLVELVLDGDVDSVSLSKGDTDVRDIVNIQQGSSTIGLPSEVTHDVPLDQNGKPNWKVSMGNGEEAMIVTHKESGISDGNLSTSSVALQGNLLALKNESSVILKPVRKRMRNEMPPKSVMSVDEMNHLLVRHRRSSRAMRPRRSSVRDREIFAARLQIERAPIVVNDQELHAPLFRNVSQFRRSYELMERNLKVYVYKDGSKPIFHQPLLKGLYASEGWFMKLMEGNKRFVVKDPRRAHLFYIPFSSRMLEHTLYVRNSHNRTNLRQYLKEYSEKIAGRYPYWNRTGGADHFLVACHDWAPYETRHHMEHCLKALCNADVTAGFKIGRDVSLPETYVRSARNPLRDLGGKPSSQRRILAFYAGNMHGYLRPILLEHWKDKDPDMKIFGPMPPGVASKMNYIQHMKSSKYCICPKGYEVNSPRVVEAIFYECVPVIISDNFVPPFFEVLNWEAFSIILAEKDIPSLKEILLSIPEKKYLEMQQGVKKVQQHFLWHTKPTRYDLFHMTLHSIWYNRVHQIKLR